MFDQLFEKLKDIDKIVESVPAWTRSVAEKYLAEIEPILQKAGYKGTIIGSVATEGFSEHDLDIWLAPIGEKGDFEVIEDEFLMAGEDYIGEDQPHYTILPDGKSVDFHLAEEEGELEEAKAANDQEKMDYFLERTNKHIELVQAAAAKIVEAYPEEFADLADEVKDHDDSKLKEPELTPYIAITWRHKLEKEKGEFDPIKGKGYQTPGKLEKKDEDGATLHHIKNNSHHPEFWLDDKTKANIGTNRDDSIACVDAIRMPDIAIAEMVADWQAMSEELQTNTAREWFNKVKDVRWHFSEHQEELIDRLLKVFE